MTPLASADQQIVATVVIPAFQASKTIAEQLRGLADQDFSEAWEVIVVDDGSTDATAELAASHTESLPHLRVLRNPRNSGPNHARNLGAAQAAGEFLLFCDADDVVSPTWVAGLVAALRNADGAGGRLDLESLNLPRLLSRKRPTPEQTMTLLTAAHLPAPFGCCCGVRRDIWEKLGGFDERIRWGGGDEIDFFWRLQLTGYRLVSAPTAVVARRMRGSLRKTMWQELRYGYAATQLLRNYGSHPHLAVSPPAQNTTKVAGRRLPTLVCNLGWISGRVVGRLFPDRAWKPMAIPTPKT